MPRPNAQNRRETRRYPTEAKLTYKVIEGPGSGVLSGHGSTVNLSAGGILFESGGVLPVGSTVEISVAWPARLNGVVPLRLWMVGRIVRAEGTRTAVQIGRHEFRTSGAVRAAHAGSQELGL